MYKHLKAADHVSDYVGDDEYNGCKKIVDVYEQKK